MTPLELELAQTHRQNQTRLEAQVSLQLVGLFQQMVEPEDLAATTRSWLPVAMTVVDDAHRQSNTIARSYIEVALQTRLGAQPGRLPRPTTVADAVRTSLFVRGPGIVGRARARGMDIDSAFRMATAEQARAGSRHALNGGRQTIDEYVASDRRAGWRRVTASTACSFCSLLAGRGAVYSEATVGFQAHDGCNCQPAIEFSA